MSTEPRPYKPSVKQEDNLASDAPLTGTPKLVGIGRRHIDGVKWAAGYIDGEGCFRVGIYPSKPRFVARCTAQLVLENTHLPSLCFLQELFGGSVRASGLSRNKPNCRNMFCWAVGGSVAGRTTEMLLPYLHEKRPQALLFMELRRGMCTGGRRPSEAIITRRLEIVKEMKRLKRPLFAHDDPRVDKPGRKKK